MMDFQSDLQEYRGQQGEQPIGSSPGSQVNPNFGEDIQAYRAPDSSPIVAKQAEYNKKVENTKREQQAQLQAQQEQMENNQEHQANAPENLEITPNIEIDYAKANLTDKDITAVPEGTVGGQCGVYAQNITKLPNGSPWRVGDTIQEKANSLENYKQHGLAFYRGEDVPKVGNAVVMNPGTKWGHIAVVNSINPDGTVTLTESNWNWDKKVTHSRKVNMNDPTILGYIRTQ